MDRGEAEWLGRLAAFDRAGGWATDGQLCYAHWLVWQTRMSRSTAFEKLRVAHELSRRPIVAAAFREGQLSYSAVRAITRIEDPDPGVDEALVKLAQAEGATIMDVERAVRSYRLYADQERAIAPEVDRARDVKITRGEGGTGQVIATLSDVEVEEVAAAFRAFLDQEAPARTDVPVHESSREDSRAGRKADGFMGAGEDGAGPCR